MIFKNQLNCLRPPWYKPQDLIGNESLPDFGLQRFNFSDGSELTVISQNPFIGPLVLQEGQDYFFV